MWLKEGRAGSDDKATSLKIANHRKTLSLTLLAENSRKLKQVSFTFHWVTNLFLASNSHNNGRKISL